MISKRIITLLFLVMIPFSSLAQIFSLNLNTLSTLGLSADAELEMAISKKHTIAPGITIKPFGNNRIGCVHLMGRIYRKESFVGPFISFGAGYGTYSIKPNEGKSIFMTVGGGYNFILKKRLNLKLEIGAGLFFARDGYIERTPDPWEDDYKYVFDRILFIPYPVSVSLCYIF